MTPRLPGGRRPPSLLRCWGLGLAMVAALLSGAGCVHTAPFRDAEDHVVPGSIATMEYATMNGLPQRLWVRGLDRARPALILLHGGPGISEAPLFRAYQATLEHHFLVVYWEQRGAGRSFRADIPPASMTIAHFLRDLDAVVELVRRRFGKDRVVLLGHSWGTVLGTLYTFQYPDKVAAYVGTGQVADMRAGERLSYDFALAEARRREHAAALRALHAIGPPPHAVDAMLTSRTWVERLGGAFHGRLSTGKLIWAALRTDEASLVDLITFGRGNRFSLAHLWPEFSQLDLTPYRSFAVPLFFVLGRYDWQVPAVLAAQYFTTIDAPCKRLVWFEHSAHHPPFEEPAQFQAVLLDHVLPLVQAQTRTCPAPSVVFYK